MSRVVFLSDFNAHNMDWNINNGSERREVAGIEKLMDTYHLILNKEKEMTIRHTQRKTTSILDWTFTTPEISALDT